MNAMREKTDLFKIGFVVVKLSNQIKSNFISHPIHDVGGTDKKPKLIQLDRGLRPFQNCVKVKKTRISNSNQTLLDSIVQWQQSNLNIRNEKRGSSNVIHRKSSLLQNCKE